MDDDAIQDAFAVIGPVSIRKMFGGKGIYADGMIVAVVFSTGDLCVKGDDIVRETYEAGGATQWTEAMKGRQTAMPYWRVPADVLDDRDALDAWAKMARDVAIRSAKAPKQSTSKKVK